jgi:hypothetical protein
MARMRIVRVDRSFLAVGACLAAVAGTLAYVVELDPETAALDAAIRTAAAEIALARDCEVPERLAMRMTLRKLGELDARFVSVRKSDIALELARAVAKVPRAAPPKAACDELQPRPAAGDDA